MKRDAWFPFNVGDYVRDTMHLTTEQHGAYLLLMLAYWPRGPLPDNDAALASIAKVPLTAWRKMRPTIQAFFQIAEGNWNQKRIDRERMKAFAITEVRKASGTEGASKRWGNGIANATREPRQTDRHTTITKTNTLPSSTQSGSAREPQPPYGAGSALDDGGSPKAISSLIGKLESRLIEQVASKKF